jgi:hypothetical protein
LIIKVITLGRLAYESLRLVQDPGITFVVTSVLIYCGIAGTMIVIGKPKQSEESHIQNVSSD